MDRSALIAGLAERIAGIACPHPVRVGTDGVDGVGKTRLADELAAALSNAAGPSSVHQWTVFITLAASDTGLAGTLQRDTSATLSIIQR